MGNKVNQIISTLYVEFIFYIIYHTITSAFFILPLTRKTHKPNNTSHATVWPNNKNRELPTFDGGRIHNPAHKQQSGGNWHINRTNHFSNEKRSQFELIKRIHISPTVTESRLDAIWTLPACKWGAILFVCRDVRVLWRHGGVTSAGASVARTERRCTAAAGSAHASTRHTCLQFSDLFILFASRWNIKVAYKVLFATIHKWLIYSWLANVGICMTEINSICPLS